MERKELIRAIYLYLFSLVGLVIVVIGLVNLVDLGLKAFVFKNADRPIIYPAYPAKLAPPDARDNVVTPAPAEDEKYKIEQEEAQRKQQQSDRERSASNALAMIIIGAPLFLYHWRIIQKDRKN